MSVHLVAPQALLAELPEAARARAHCVPVEDLDDARWAPIEAALAGGDSLIAVGLGALGRLRHLWVDAYEVRGSQLRACAPEALPLPRVDWSDAACRGISIRPDTLNAYFGTDEMPRVDLVPLVEAADGCGPACAYPAVWLKHFAASLVGGRFAGSNWYLFAFEDPLRAASAQSWANLIDALCDHAEAQLSIAHLETHYACCRPDETVLVQVGVANRSERVEAVRLELTAVSPSGTRRTSRAIRRCLNGHEEVTVPWEFVAGDEAGPWRVQAELHREDRFAYGAARREGSQVVERASCGFVVAPKHAQGFARPAIDGRRLTVGDSDGFLAGTHYYPSSSWWDWAWRGFRPERAERDLAEMARLGYRLVRVWVDPELDEQALRGLEAWLYLSGARGIVSIVCVFTQWARDLAYPDGDQMVSFEFMGPADTNVYSVQLTNIEHQRRYLGVLAKRWRHLPNIIWNLSNEAYIVDPDPDQMDPHNFGDVEPKRGPLAGAALFNRWADLMTEAVRANGAHQPILRGYGFVNGGDCYLQNRDGDLLTWHHYAPADIAGPCLTFALPGSLGKPLLMEEFGIPTLDEDERLAHYEGIACWAAAMGAAGACSYEWGVSWLTRELPYVATPLKDSCLFEEPDPRWMAGQIEYSKSWPMGSMGLCPWAASFSYGSNRPCTPFATPAAEALGEVAQFCTGIGPPVGMAPVLLVVPMEWAQFVPLSGYQRVLDPTWQAVHKLAAAHVPFSVIQEDQLPSFDGRPKAVVFAASQAVRPKTQAELGRLRERGAAVCIGSVDAHIEALAPYAMDVVSDAPVWCVRRGTRHGSLYMVFAPETPARVSLTENGASVELEVRRYALVEIRRDGRTRQWVGRATAPNRR